MFRTPNRAFYAFFTRSESRSGQTARSSGARLEARHRRRGPHPRRPDVEPRQSGLSAGFFMPHRRTRRWFRKALGEQDPLARLG